MVAKMVFRTHRQTNRFDDLVNATGECGRYQRRLLILVTFVVVVSGYNTSLPIFLLTIPAHRCALDGVPNDTYHAHSNQHAALINRTIPLKDGDWSSCTILRHDVREDGVREEDCDRWVFDPKYFDRSLIGELGIVCGMKQWRAHGNMAMMVGKLVSGAIQGYCSDMFGRRVTLLAFLLVVIGSTFAQAFIFNIASLLAFRFLAGLATTSVYLNCMVLALEFVGPRYRQTASVVVAQCWVLGGFVLVAAAVSLRDFQHLSLALATPTVLFLVYFWMVPESPRWLVTKGRTEEAKVILKNMAKVNGTAFPERVFDEMVEEMKEEEKQKQAARDDGQRNTETLLNVFKHRRLATRMVIVLWNWAANSLTFYGILLNVQNLSGSIYLNFTFACCVDFAGNIAAYFLVDRLGRKVVYSGFLLVAVAACLSAIFPSLYAEKAVMDTCLIVLSMVGRFGISTAFNILYLYSAELFPTTVRNSSMGLMSMTSRVGSISAPYIADLGLLIGGELKSALPLFVFGGAGLLAFLMTLLLPETNGRKLAETIREEITGNKQTDSEQGRPEGLGLHHTADTTTVQRTANKNTWDA